MYQLDPRLPVSDCLVEDNLGASTLGDRNSATAGIGGGPLEVSLLGSVPVARSTGSLNLNVVIKRGVSGGFVGEEGNVGQSILEADTHVHGSKVTHVTAGATPGASNALIFASGVNVVLSRGGLSFPLIVGRSIGIGQRRACSGFDDSGKSLTFSSFLRSWSQY